MDKKNHTKGVLRIVSTYFSDILKKLRAEKGISQQTLAEKMYVNRSTVTRWESGIRLPDAMMISRLAEIFGTDVNVLLAAVAESDECPNVIMVDDRKLILTGGMPIWRKSCPMLSLRALPMKTRLLHLQRGTASHLLFLISSCVK